MAMKLSCRYSFCKLMLIGFFHAAYQIITRPVFPNNSVISKNKIPAIVKVFNDYFPDIQSPGMGFTFKCLGFRFFPSL